MNEFESGFSTEFAVRMARKCRELHRGIRSLPVAALGAALWVAGLTVSSTPALAQFTDPTPSIPLTLVNGWTNAPFNTGDAAVLKSSGIVHFKGAVANGSSAVMFTLPAGFRPLTDVYIPVDLCDATNGRLHIMPSGETEVDAEGGNFGNAQCFTSLDGASFALRTTGFTQLTLVNGWTNAPFNTSNAMARKSNGIVQFKGAVASGSNAVMFTLPAGFRPLTDVYIPIDLCQATNGRIHIVPSGVVDVEAEDRNFGNAQCFTSLDGASFALRTTGFTPLTLVNGWTNAPFNTSKARVRKSNGIVQFKGAIANGSNAVMFTLPAAFRPSTDVYVQVDLCNATNGRIHIVPSGVVEVEAEGGNFSNAQCFTSLDGASFAP